MEWLPTGHPAHAVPGNDSFGPNLSLARGGNNPPVPHPGGNAGPLLWLTRGRDGNVVPALSLSPVSSSNVVPELLP